jgi:hypothetical protein
MTIFIRFTILILLWGGIFFPFAYAATTNFGRLFTTPEERAALEVERNKIPEPPTTGKKEEGKKKPGPLELEPPPHITFNGLMTRSQGPTIVWINGSKINGSNKVQKGFIVELDKMQGITVPIFLSKAQQRCFLKPGQTLNTRDKRVQEKEESAQENPEEVKPSCISTTHNQDLP